MVFMPQDFSGSKTGYSYLSYTFARPDGPGWGSAPVEVKDDFRYEHFKMFQGREGR